MALYNMQIQQDTQFDSIDYSLYKDENLMWGVSLQNHPDGVFLAGSMPVSTSCEQFLNAAQTLLEDEDLHDPDIILYTQDGEQLFTTFPDPQQIPDEQMVLKVVTPYLRVGYMKSSKVGIVGLETRQINASKLTTFFENINPNSFTEPEDREAMEIFLHNVHHDFLVNSPEGTYKPFAGEGTAVPMSITTTVDGKPVTKLLYPDSEGRTYIDVEIQPDSNKYRYN